MKKAILFLFIQAVFCLNISHAATYYVDAVNGNDSWNGTSTGTAWKTINKVNLSSFLPGDFILFKRGDTFRGNLTPKSGSASGYITYGAYGTGNKPLLLGSISRKLISDWTNVGTNLWQTSGIKIGSQGVDVGNIIFNNEESCGVKVSSESNLNTQGKFYSNVSRKFLKIYSVGNPGSYYSNIELVLKGNIISVSGKSYIICENLDLRYGGSHGIGGGSNTHHMIIRDMNFSYIGGSYLSGTTRYGNGVEFYNGANTNTIERCTFSQIYDVAMTCQGDLAGYQVYDIYFQSNIVSKCEQSFEFWVRGSGASANNICFINNTCVNAGMGWSHSQRPDPNGTHLLFWGSDASSSFSNIVIRNNIFSGAANSGIFEAETNLSDLNITKVTINNNDWYVPLPNILAVMTGWDNVNNAPITTLYDWNYYLTNTGQEANSITSDPLLTSSYSILSSSPCVNTGVTLSYVTNDFILTSRPQGSAYDIGAYEYISNLKSAEVSTGNKVLLQEDIPGQKVSLYPNPVSNILTIDNIEIGSVVTVTDINGRVVKETKANNPVSRIEMSGLRSGVYIIKAQSLNGLCVRKVIKQ
jgi:hypothetical protein